MSTIIIAMRPIGKARARKGTGHFYTPASTAKAEEDIGNYWKEAHGDRFDPGVPLRLFVLATFKRKRSDPEYHVKTPDGSNILKLCEDALNTIAYDDDSQIVDTYCKKVYGTYDSLLITVEAAT